MGQLNHLMKKKTYLYEVIALIIRLISQNIDNNSIITRILETSFSHDKNKYLKVLDDPSNNIIKIINFNSNLNINSSCPIFQTDFEENEEIGMLPCKHCFNFICRLTCCCMKCSYD